MFRRACLASLYSLFLLTAACTSTAITTGATVSSCGSAGANMNEHDVGDEPGGVALDLGDVAVAPTGAFVMFKGTSDLLVGWPFDAHVDELSVKWPTRLAFSRKRNVVYVGSALDDRIHAVDVAFDEELWSAPIGGPDKLSMRLTASKDDARLVVVSGPHLTILDTATGKAVAEHDFASAVVDVQILPDDQRALVVTEHAWPSDASTPTTEIEVVSIVEGKVTSFDVPNCSSTLSLTPDGNRAFLSPTYCNKDPISLLDLTPGKEGWVKNLPGFGPLALGPTGATAVAFLDTQNLDESLFDDPTQIPPHAPTDPRYHLMTLDTHTLKYEFTLWGDSIPRYQLTPDGLSLLVDQPLSASPELAPVHIFDTETHVLRQVTGAKVTLDDFVLTDDSKHVYALKGGLVDLDISAGAATTMATGAMVPENINTSPDGSTLYLRESTRSICIYDVAEETCTGHFAGPTPRRASSL
ncbi:Hypothetical protein A7982_10145 [Minicystis rosea]|nr:Hypothetical protein A7982_10145 [Minicystis rosea]